MKIGIFGGTFDPIHNGHLIIAETALSTLSLDKIFFIPNANPPHKNENEIVANKNDRYQMTLIAIQNNPKFFISNFEMDEKHKYSYQTIEYFTKNTNDEIFFILGLDSFNNIGKWMKGYELLKLCKFVIINRPNEKLENNKGFIGYEKNILIINDINIGISSTLIKTKIKQKLSIKYLVPLEIENYIYSNKLYTENKGV